MRHSVFIAALGAAVLLPAVAHAQAAAGVQSSAGDNGIKLGDGRLHPYGEVDTHYVVNPGRLASDLPNSSINDGYVAMKAGLDYELKSPSLELTFKGQGSRNQYFSETQLNGWNADVGAEMIGYKEGPLEFRLKAGYIRSQMPANQAIIQTVDHDDVTAGAGITARPGGGALTLSGDFSYYQQFYDRDAENQQVLGPNPEFFNLRRMSPSVRAGWKFLPKTSIFVEAKMDFADFPDDAVGQNIETQNLQTAIGVSGALTTRLSILLKAGYGDPFSDDGSDFVPFVGQAEVGYYISDTSKVQVGVIRATSPQPIFAYVADNSVYAGWDQQIGAVLFSASAEAGILEFGQQQGASGSRTDQSLKLGFSINYPMNDWLTLGLSESFDFRSSNSGDITLIGADGTPTAQRDFGYTHNDVFLRLSARY